MESSQKSIMSSSENEPQSLLNVRQRYTALQNLIGQLSVQVSNVASSAENEFLAAYRVHMLSIQAELKELNEQVAKEEEQLNDDGQVAKLEHEVSWFKDESSRLKANSESMCQDLKAMVQKLQALKEQNQFLSEQLKSVMKRSRVLESELEFSVNEQNFEQDDVGSMSSIDASEQIKSSRPTKVPAISLSKDQIVRSVKPSKSTNKMFPGQSRHELAQKDSLLPAIGKSKMKTHHISFTESLEETLRSRRRAEIELEIAIKKTLENVVARKISTTAQTALRPELILMQKRQLKTKIVGQESGPGGITGLGLNHFTELDRLEAMVQVLTTTISNVILFSCLHSDTNSYHLLKNYCKFLSVPHQFEKVVNTMLS